MTSYSPYLEQIINEKNSTCNMQVVFVDIVSYSKRNSHAQVEVINTFKVCLETALDQTAAHFKADLEKMRLKLRESVILLPAGDGAAIGFPFDGLHDMHLVFAVALLGAIGKRNAIADCVRFRRQDWCDCHDAMKIRTGVSEGKLIVYKDINDNFNVAGTTVNLAARVMSVADADEILFSEEAYRLFNDMTRGIASKFIGYSDVVVKHGLTLTVYQYANKQVKYLTTARNPKRGVLLTSKQPPPPATQKSAAVVAPVTPAHLASNRSAGSKSAGVSANTKNALSQRVFDRLAEIAPGKFRMGDKSEVADVTITRPFLVDRYSMTQDLYQEVMGRCDSRFKGAQLPVDSVTWMDAAEFCNALSRRTMRDEVYQVCGKHVLIDPTANGFRLPSEAEWEYVCSGGENTPIAKGALNSVAWFGANARQTQVVGQLQPNANGLFDMLGNVWEWCNDWYEKRDANLVLIDPVGPQDGMERVVRGGSWEDLAASISATYRSRRDPSTRSANLGFRIAVNK